jgi:spore germination protein YaaH
MFMRRPVVFTFLLVLLAAQAAASPYNPNIDSKSYLYFGTTTTYIKHAERAEGRINIISPDYMEPNPDGSLKITAKADSFFVSVMHSKGIKVVPNINNHWNRETGRAVIANRHAFAKQVAQAVADYNLDGVGLDIQNINHEDRDGITDTIRLIRQALPPDKILNAAVAANPWNWQIGWHGAYDYAAIAPHVDWLFIMTYDESYNGGKAGPVASLPFIERSVQMALNHTTPCKIMMGIPFYGRYWKEGESYGGLALTVSDIENLVKRYDSKTWYDSASHCMRATMTIPENSVATGLWGNRTLTAGVYDIWYENAESYKAKLALVKKYNLRGAGSWALGQEPEWVWQHYNSWLRGLPFTDIENNWAERYVVSLFDRGIVTGTPAGRYEPDRSLTRAEAAVLLCRMLGLSESPGAAAFSDTGSHWARGFINTAHQCGIARGTGDGRFFPNAHVTRQEMAALIERCMALQRTFGYGKSLFPDVNETTPAWARDAIHQLAHEGIINGYPDGLFHPLNRVTRAESAKMVSIAADKVLRTFTVSQRLGLEEIVDMPLSPR